MTKPAIQFVAPYQTVCNYFVYFFNPLGTHQSAVVPGGTAERILAKLVDTQQENSLGSTESKKPVDIPSGQDPQAEPAKQVLHTQYGGPAVDSQGRADCQGGQTGYPFRLVSTLRATRAATSWSTRTRPGWPAAPTSRASSGSRA